MAVEAYRAFVAEGRDQPGRWEKQKNPVCLGSDAFVREMLARVSPGVDLSEVPSGQRKPTVKALEQYVVHGDSRDDAIVRHMPAGALA